MLATNMQYNGICRQGEMNGPMKYGISNVKTLCRRRHPYWYYFSWGRSAQTDRNIETPSQPQQFFSELPHGATASFTLSWHYFICQFTGAFLRCFILALFVIYANECNVIAGSDTSSKSGPINLWVFILKVFYALCNCCSKVPPCYLS